MRTPVVGLAAYSKLLADKKSHFVGNLPTYINALHDAGAIVLQLPDPRNTEHLHRVLDAIDALMMPGGSDIDPALYGEPAHAQLGGIQADRDRYEIALVKAALQRNIPVLGICRGMQLFNVALGGSLYQDIPSQCPSMIQHNGNERAAIVHTIELTANSQLSKLLHTRTLRANSLHHQSVHQPGDGVVVTGKAPDGIIEAIEAPQYQFAIGVQYHPEELYATDEQSRALFANFVQAASLVKK